jgi:thiamine phosphate synthase YjbQ (UPF0047 family)
MKSYRKELWFNTSTRVGFVNITGQVQECIRDSGINDGLVLVNAMHITASVFINDDESGLHHDYGVWLEKLAPTSRSNSTVIMIAAKTMPTRTSSGR